VSLHVHPQALSGIWPAADLSHSSHSCIFLEILVASAVHRFHASAYAPGSHSAEHAPTVNCSHVLASHAPPPTVAAFAAPYYQLLD
jgi:hypothetical protein